MGAEWMLHTFVSVLLKHFSVTGLPGVAGLWCAMPWECPLSPCINGACQAQSTHTSQTADLARMAPWLIPGFASEHSKLLDLFGFFVLWGSFCLLVFALGVLFVLIFYFVFVLICNKKPLYRSFSCRSCQSGYSSASFLHGTRGKKNIEELSQECMQSPTLLFLFLQQFQNPDFNIW